PLLVCVRVFCTACVFVGLGSWCFFLYLEVFFYAMCFVFLVCLCLFLFFFFSSRRRHTRSLRDWSSDVCSSDLRSTAAGASAALWAGAVPGRSGGAPGSARRRLPWRARPPSRAPPSARPPS